MELFEALRSRRSIRSYTEEPVSDELLAELLDAAMLAPSAGNQQPWHFVVIRDRHKLDKIPNFHPYSKMVLKATVAILICGDPEGKKWPAFWSQDCSAATQNLLLAARGLGLGSVWAGVYPEEGRMDGFRKLLGIPENIYPFAFVPLGWPDVDFQVMNRFRPELIHNDRW